MSNTRLFIESEDFSLQCPHCSEKVEEVWIHTSGNFGQNQEGYSVTQECSGCLSEFTISIIVEV